MGSINITHPILNKFELAYRGISLIAYHMIGHHPFTIAFNPFTYACRFWMVCPGYSGIMGVSNESLGDNFIKINKMGKGSVDFNQNTPINDRRLDKFNIVKRNFPDVTNLYYWIFSFKTKPLLKTGPTPDGRPGYGGFGPSLGAFFLEDTPFSITDQSGYDVFRLSNPPRYYTGQVKTRWDYNTDSCVVSNLRPDEYVGWDFEYGGPHNKCTSYTFIINFDYKQYFSDHPNLSNYI